MTSIKPLADWIVFKAILIKASSGIVLPDQSKLDSSLVKNIVRAVGPKVKTIRPGDEIIVLPQQRLKLNYPEREVEADLFMTREKEVCGKIVEGKKLQRFSWWRLFCNPL